jgi:hypothetical protein
METQDPDVQKLIRLVNYLTAVARLRTKLMRDLTEYQNVVWLSRVPHERGCFTRAWAQDEEHEPDEWVEVQNWREPELPSVPAQCKDWINRLTLRKKSDLPELLPEIVREIPNLYWRKGPSRHSDEWFTQGFTIRSSSNGDHCPKAVSNHFHSSFLAITQPSSGGRRSFIRANSRCYLCADAPPAVSLLTSRSA